MSEPNYQTTKFFTECLLAIEMKMLINKPVYSGAYRENSKGEGGVEIWSKRAFFADMNIQ